MSGALTSLIESIWQCECHILTTIPVIRRCHRCQPLRSVIQTSRPRSRSDLLCDVHTVRHFHRVIVLGKTRHTSAARPRGDALQRYVGADHKPEYLVKSSRM